MTECEEVADAFPINLDAIITFDDAFRITKNAIGNESYQVLSEVAHALFRKAVRHATEAVIGYPLPRQ